MPSARRCLEGVIATTTGLEVDERDALKAQLEQMGARMSSHLHGDCTHLIAREHGSKKAQARRLSDDRTTPTDAHCAVSQVASTLPTILIVTPDWVQACYERRNDPNFDHRAIASKFLLPPFINLVICLTNFDVDEVDRSRIEALTVQNGGSYTADLNRSVTHLICAHPGGNKWNFAETFKMQTVSIDWFWDCVRKKTRLPEDQYPVPPKAEPQSAKKAPSSSVAETAPAAKPQRSSGVAATAAPPPRPNLAPAAASRAPEDVDGIAGLLAEHSSQQDHAEYLANTRIYFSQEFAADKKAQLRRIVRIGGGMTSDDYSTSVTHFVCRDMQVAASDEAQLKLHKRLPHVVHYYWLRESLRQQALAPLPGFAVALPPSLAPPPPQAPQPASQAPAQPARPQIRRAGKSGDRMGEMLSVLQEELPPAHGKPPVAPQRRRSGAGSGSARAGYGALDIADAKPPPAKEAKPVSAPVAGTGRHEALADTPQAAVAPAVEEELRDGTVFQGVTIVCYGFPDETFDSIKRGVEAQQGRCVREPPRAQIGACYVVVPLNCSDLPQHVAEAGTVATAYWLQSCVDDERLYSPNDHVLFRPSAHRLPLECFAGLVMCVSGYVDGTEREVLGRLVTDLGGKWSEQLSRRTTHLVFNTAAGERSAKYEKALEWGATAVSAEWLYACLAEGRLVDTADHAPVDLASLVQKENLPSSSRSFTFRRPVEGTPVDVAAKVGTLTTRCLYAARSGGDAALLHPRMRKAGGSGGPLAEAGAETPASDGGGFGAAVDELVSGSRPSARHRVRPAKKEPVPPAPEDGDSQGNALPLLGGPSQEARPAGGGITYDDPDGRVEKRKLMEQVTASKRLRTPKMESRTVDVVSAEEVAAIRPRTVSRPAR
ncbi:hypothetical protein DFJ74DRAFT_774576 [Hyaloraphidium curvatum]|nr:hypothetical protein DFJ74DRAFT_774576 [Hyaloraphidium curvatum]